MGESPTYLGLKELPIMDQIPTEALHILAEGGGGGGGGRGLLWLVHYSKQLIK